MTNQEAIRLIRNLPTMCEFTDAYGKPIDSDAYYEAVDMTISAFQEQEAKHSNESSKTQKALDTISRQAAIDELKRISFSHWFECGEYLSEDTREIKIISSSKALEAIEALPPAQPERCEDCENFSKTRLLIPQSEIIRCKDCKHHHYDSKDIPYCDRIDYGYGWKDDDFCSRAERRTDEGSDRTSGGD